MRKWYKIFNQKEYTKRYHQGHKEKEKEYFKQYCKNNPEKRKQSIKQWYGNNPEYNKQYYIKNKEKIKERSKQWHEKNREKKREYTKQYSRDNRKKCNEYKKQHYRKKYEWLQNYKLSKGCSVCEYNKCANALEFHHNGDKEFLINTACGKSLKKIKEEIEKCTLLCANCHRELHSKEGAIGWR